MVSSGGNQIIVWKVQTSPKVAFVQEGATVLPASGQDPGTFTTVSSNGTNAGSAIVWATGRPLGPLHPEVHLYAFAATPSSGHLPLLFSSVAGQWPDTSRNANIVPVVANGQVYVASNQQLTIFGLGGHSFVALASPSVASTVARMMTDAGHPWNNFAMRVFECRTGPSLCAGCFGRLRHYLETRQG